MFDESTIRGRLQRKELRWVLSCVARNSNGPLQILDAGCGPGRYLRALSQMGHHVVGYDFSRNMLELCKGEAADSHAAFIQGEIQHEPFKDGQFDIVLMLDVLHHLQSSQMRARAIEEAFRVSRCRVIVDVKNGLNPVLWYRYRRQNDSLPRTAYTYREIGGLINRHGGHISQSVGLGFPAKIIAPYILIEALKA
jgi:ubiquinone/menaquinone biosynthesis C-methylase UbiE